MAGALTVVRLGGAADRLRETGIGPTRLHQQVMRTPERDQAAFNRLLAMFDARGGAKALRCDCADRCQRILDAVMHLVENELLQFIGRFALFGINTRLRK